jgi:hypothetical protein
MSLWLAVTSNYLLGCMSEFVTWLAFVTYLVGAAGVVILQREF